MGGAIYLEDIKQMLNKIGFRDIGIYLEEVTDEYARKWGYGLGLKEYIGHADIIAYK